MRIIVSLLLVFAVLCALLVLEVRHGTLASIVNLFDDRSLPYREPGPSQPDDGPACLKRLDAMDGIGIAVAPIPRLGLGAAINDRLQRAAAPR